MMMMLRDMRENYIDVVCVIRKLMIIPSREIHINLQHNRDKVTSERRKYKKCVLIAIKDLFLIPYRKSLIHRLTIIIA